MNKIFLGIFIVTIVIVGSITTIRYEPVRFFISDLAFEYRFEFRRQRDVMIPMRDGIKLATDIYLPSIPDETHPSILIRTTYAGADFDHIKYFVNNGYSVLVQDVRARYNSEGNNYSPHRFSRTDGYDTIDWIVKQPWSSGKVGTFGCSYQGESQIILAAEKHPNHIAMIVDGAGGAIGNAEDSYGYFGIYENGVLNLATALGWFTKFGAKEIKTTPQKDFVQPMQQQISSLPVIDIGKKIVSYQTGYEDYISNPLTSQWWSEEGYINRNDTFSAATLHVNSWYDLTIHDTFRLAKFMSDNAVNDRAKHQAILIDPGIHCSSNELSDGTATVGDISFDYKKIDFMKIYLDWYDHWLKGSPTPLPPKVQFFLINSGEWKTERAWPPEDIQMKSYYFDNNFQLSANPTEDNTSLDSYIYDPLNPTPTVGGPICCTGTEGSTAGPKEQSILSKRKDLLIYTTPPLNEDMDIVGSIKANLFVSTSARDTDFNLKIVDKHPNGKSYNLHDGVIRLRYRNGIEKPELVESGTIYEVNLELRPIAYRVKAGHRVVAYISSSNFPRLSRNLNSGNDEYTDDEVYTAHNKIYHGDIYPSRIDIPVKHDSKP